MYSKTRQIFERTVLVIALFACLPGPAAAGFKSKWPLTIDLAVGVVTGSLATVRASRNTTEQLGCSVRANINNGGETIVFCWAISATGVNANCSIVNNPPMVSAVAAINPDSIVQFNFDSAGTCTNIEIMNASWAEPKVQ